MDDPVLLHVSDDPESFRDRGQLFRAPVRPGAVSRMFLDHVNGCAQPMRVIACLANAGAEATQCSVIGESAGPAANGMQVGHDATAAFLRTRELARQAPTDMIVPPGQSMVLLTQTLAPGDCVAGIFDVEPSANAELDFRVMACDPVNQSPDVFEKLPPAKGDGIGRRGVFDIAGASDISESWSGQPIAFKFGEDSHARDASDPYQGPAHAGEYAITKRFACTLNDTTGAGASTALYASPRGGKATATFIIDSEIVEARGAQAGQRYKVSQVDVPAGGETKVSVVTMAEINSYYPFELSISADDTQISDPFSGDSPLYRR